jgi:hypothetical protein
MVQSLRGEEARVLAMIGNFSPDAVGADLHSSQSPIDESSGPAALYFRVFFLDVPDYVRLTQDAREWAMLPYYQVPGRLKELKTRPADWMTSLLAPANVNTIEALNSEEAIDSCAAVAIAITRYRVDHGRMPANLAALIPGYLDALPIDPFNGKPIRLAKESDRWIIYSVGPDSVDNGGAPIRSNGQPGDLIFTLKLSPPVPATRP